MFKFNNYPIYVVYSRNWQKKVEPIQRQVRSDLEFHQRSLQKMSLGDFGRSSSLKTISSINKEEGLLAASFGWDIEEDVKPIYKKEIKNYESQVKLSLITISHTRIGQLLLNSTNKQSKIYIIPLYDYNIKYASITSGPYTEAEGGGVRIAYNPNEFRKTWRGGVVADQRASVLFHELVHASRKSNYRSHQAPLPGGSFPNTEEFIATQFENIYISTTGESKVYSLYDSGHVSKEVAYDVLIKNPQLILALRNFLQTEPLAQAAAKLTEPVYNPFRDYKELEEASHKHFGTGGFIDL